MLEKAPALGRGKTGVFTVRREVECFYKAIRAVLKSGSRFSHLFRSQKM